jgi:processive 1,2-diacylglycerol beta-glucosyltransferase
MAPERRRIRIRLPRGLDLRLRTRFRAQRLWWRRRLRARSTGPLLFPDAGGGVVAVETLAGGSPAGPRIAILHASSGTGHMAAAKAVAGSLAALEPRATVREVDALLFASRFYQRAYGRGYDLLAARAPKIWGALYRSWELAPFRRGTTAVRMIDRLNLMRLAKVVKQERPDAVLCTHFLPVEALAPAPGRKPLHVPLYCVITDFVAHPFWALSNVDRYFVATDQVKAELVRAGVARERIEVTGIPVDARFNKTIGREVARRHLGLPIDRGIVLVMGGGSGVGPITELVERLTTLPNRPLVVALCGSNQRLRAELDELPVARAGDLRAVGFTREVDMWMEAADVLIGKAGGLTCSEALIKGLPMVVFRPTPGQEVRNALYLESGGAAIHAESLDEVAMAVDRWLRDPAARARACAHALAMAKPEAVGTIAASVLAAAREHLATRG